LGETGEDEWSFLALFLARAAKRKGGFPLFFWPRRGGQCGQSGPFRGKNGEAPGASFRLFLAMAAGPKGGSPFFLAKAEAGSRLFASKALKGP
jgi:hypothetical protein